MIEAETQTSDNTHYFNKVIEIPKRPKFIRQEKKAIESGG